MDIGSLKTVRVAAKYLGKNYKVEAMVFAVKQVGQQRRKCVSSGCDGLASRPIFQYQLKRVGAITDDKGDPVSAHLRLYWKIDRDILLLAASKNLNAWLGSQAKPADLSAPEFQPGGIRSIESDLPLCITCLMERRDIFFSDEILMAAGGGTA